MAVRPAGHVERIRGREPARVAVRRRLHQQETLSRLDSLSAVLHRLRDLAPHRLRRAVETQDLLDRIRHPRRIGGERRPRRVVLEDRLQAVGEQIAGGLVAGEQQQHAGGDDLLLLQHVAALLGRDQIADQIVARPRPAVGDHAAQELGELPQAALGAFMTVRAVHRVEDEGEDVFRPAGEVAAVLVRDAEEIADDAHRQRTREALDEVELALRCELLRQLVDEGRDPAAHALHRAGAEGVVHQLAHPRVPRRIDEHDPAGQHLEGRPLAFRHAVRAAALEVRTHSIGGQARVAERVAHVVVAEHEPGAEALVAVQRRGFPQGRQVRVRVGHRVIGEQLGDLCHAMRSSFRQVAATVPEGTVSVFTVCRFSSIFDASSEHDSPPRLPRISVGLAWDSERRTLCPQSPPGHDGAGEERIRLTMRIGDGGHGR